MIELGRDLDLHFDILIALAARGLYALALQAELGAMLRPTKRSV